MRKFFTFSSFLLFFIVLFCVQYASAAADFATQIASLEKQKQELEKERAAIIQKLADIKSGKRLIPAVSSAAKKPDLPLVDSKTPTLASETQTIGKTHQAKINAAFREGKTIEAIAELQKAIASLNELRQKYSKAGYHVVGLPKNIQDAMDFISASPTDSSASLSDIEQKVRALGFQGGLREVSAKIVYQIKALASARQIEPLPQVATPKVEPVVTTEKVQKKILTPIEAEKVRLEEAAQIYREQIANIRHGKVRENKVTITELEARLALIEKRIKGE
jgi:hypothetical protein